LRSVLLLKSAARTAASRVQGDRRRQDRLAIRRRGDSRTNRTKRRSGRRCRRPPRTRRKDATRSSKTNFLLFDVTRPKADRGDTSTFRVVGRVRAEVFLDARLLAFEAAQVIELRAAHLAVTLDDDRVDRRAVRLEHALDARAVRDLAHRECRVEARVLARDHDAFVRLHALAVAFLDLDVDDDRVARAELRHLAGPLRGFA